MKEGIYFMNDAVSKELKKDGKKVFTKKRVNSKINKNYTPFRVNRELIYKRRDGLYNMENAVLRETMFIDEERYQQIKKDMCKKDDYFTKKELENFSVILA